MPIESDGTGSDETQYPSRTYDAESRRRYIARLLERLATLERETHPAGGEQTAIAKDARAAEGNTASLGTEAKSTKLRMR